MNKPIQDCSSCERAVHWKNLRRCGKCEELICTYCGHYRGESFDEPGDVYLCDACVDGVCGDGCDDDDGEADAIPRASQ